MLRTFKFCANFRSFSSCQNISSVPFNGNSHFPFTVPGNYPSTFCLYESDHSRCFILSGIIQYFSFPGRFILPSRLSTRPSLLYRVLEFPFFLMVSNALLWVPTILAYEWKACVALVLWLLWNMLWTGICKYLFQSVRSILLRTWSKVESLTQTVIRFLSACDGEDVHILKYGDIVLTYNTWFGLNFVWTEPSQNVFFNKWGKEHLFWR